MRGKVKKNEIKIANAGANFDNSVFFSPIAERLEL
jgi:hypothetical protein